MHVWKIKANAENKVRQGHPWVFREEIQATSKGFRSGSLVELLDSKGQFLAIGYGNEESKIAFRVLSLFGHEKNPLSLESLVYKISLAWERRIQHGYSGSFRLCFSEADQLPGLIIDYYSNSSTQVFALQISTAGMQSALIDAYSVLRKVVDLGHSRGWTSLNWDSSVVVLRNDISVRKHEGLEVEVPRLIKALQNVELQNFTADVKAATLDKFLQMRCDLLNGQKTGFFLDQTENINQVCHWIQKSKAFNHSDIKILDLCCYVGHWSAQLATTFKQMGKNVEVHLMDVSATALNFAQANSGAHADKVVVMQKDVLEALESMPKETYDVVIADPPAFIKAKKDLPVGKHAYLKLNTQAFRVAKKGGLVVSCSCSGLLEEEDFKDIVKKAILRNALRASLVLQGRQGTDHPVTLSFPEGQYLKMLTNQI